jgi:predicted metal-binding protein
MLMTVMRLKADTRAVWTGICMLNEQSKCKLQRKHKYTTKTNEDNKKFKTKKKALQLI